MESLSFQFPLWYILLCILLGLVVATILYARSASFSDKPLSVVLTLATLRFLSVTLISMFLLSPLLKSLELDTQKPTIVIAQDVSESVTSAWGQQQKEDYLAQLEEVGRVLSNDYDVQILSFGSSVREGLDTTFSDKVSNTSMVLDQVTDRYAGANLGGVILATDGLFNEGSNPLYASAELGVPVFSIAMGDTTPQRDLVLKSVFNNRIAYLGDKFSVQVDVSARNLDGRTSNLVVSRIANGQAVRLKEKNLKIQESDYFQTFSFVLDADQPGVQRFRFSLQPVEGEVSLSNNTKDVFIDVLDARQRILILGANPHPDLTAMRQSIRSNKNYEVDVFDIDDWGGEIRDYDLVVFHQLPGREKSVSDLLNELNENRIPRFFVLGSESDYNRINAVQALMGTQVTPRNTNEVQGRVNTTFNLFTLNDELPKAMGAYPPLTAAFGEFTDSGNGQVLLYQRIRKIDTQFPLLMLGEEAGSKTGILAAEGIWKWRLFDFLQHKSHAKFDAFFSKIIQYLSVKDDKRKFRVTMNSSIVNENEPLFFDAELYNNSYELINTPDVQMEVVDEDGNAFNYTFNKTEKAYRLNAGTLPVGNYRYEATVNYNAERLTFSGQFSIQPIQLELYETTADHSVLQLISDRSGGMLAYPQNLTIIADSIRSEEAIKPIIYQTSRTRSAINLRWLFLPLLLLLTAEWAIRRYQGSY